MRLAMTTQRYVINNTKSKQNVCLTLIREARDTRQMRCLAAYYFFKRHYRNSTLYNFRSRMDDLADVCSISTKSLYTYIGRWKAWGLVREHHNNLTLHSTLDVKKACRERHRVQITRNNKDTIKEIETRLYGKILEQHNRRMDFNRKLLERAESTKTTKRARRGDTPILQCYENRQGVPALSLSLRSAASELNLSLVKTTKIFQTLNRLGVIRTVANPPESVGHGVGLYRACRDGRLGYFFMAGDTVFRQFGNRHHFLEYPPSDKKVTIKQMMHHLRNGSPELRKRLYSVLT